MRKLLSLTAASLLLPGLLLAQAPAASTMPKVGDMAPDFTLPAATASGISAKPVKLSDLRGRTVVIAFFPRQRSGGCTHQMEGYRDQYEALFHGGKDVSLFGVSSDSVKDLASWAAEDHFQFGFLSDVAGDAGHKYGTWPATGNYEKRIVFVVAPNGKIAYAAAFNPVSATDYEALGKAINDAKGSK